MMPSFPAARTMFISPSGCPKRASAAGAAQIGRADACPKIRQDVFVFVILWRLGSRISQLLCMRHREKTHTRGRNHHCLNDLLFSSKAEDAVA